MRLCASVGSKEFVEKDVQHLQFLQDTKSSLSHAQTHRQPK